MNKSRPYKNAWSFWSFGLNQATTRTASAYQQDQFQKTLRPIKKQWSKTISILVLLIARQIKLSGQFRPKDHLDHQFQQRTKQESKQ